MDISNNQRNDHVAVQQWNKWGQSLTAWTLATLTTEPDLQTLTDFDIILKNTKNRETNLSILRHRDCSIFHFSFRFMIPSVLIYSGDITAAHVLRPGKSDIYSSAVFLRVDFIKILHNKAGSQRKSFMFLGSISRRVCSSPASTVTDAVIVQIPTGLCVAAVAMMWSIVSEDLLISADSCLITGSAA